MIKIVDCPTGCGAKISAEIDAKENYADVYCKCGKRVRVFLDMAPIAYIQCLDPRAEAIFAKLGISSRGKKPEPGNITASESDDRIRLTF